MSSRLVARLLAANAILKLATLVSCGLLAWISWRMVGARPSYGAFFTAFSYLFAAGLLIFSCLSALDQATLRLLRPELFAKIVALSSTGQDTQKLKALVGTEGTYALKALLYSNQELPAVIRTPGFFWIASMAALRGAFTFVWLIFSWTVFRKVSHASWSRFALSLAIFLGFGSTAALLIIVYKMGPIMLDTGRWLEKF